MDSGGFHGGIGILDEATAHAEAMCSTRGGKGAAKFLVRPRCTRRRHFGKLSLHISGDRRLTAACSASLQRPGTIARTITSPRRARRTSSGSARRPPMGRRSAWRATGSSARSGSPTKEQSLEVVGLPLLRRRRRRREGEQQLEPLRRRRGEEGRRVSGGAEGMRPRQRGRGVANYERSFGKIYTVKSARIH